MAEYHYCWRCQMEVPFLNEEEWAEVGPLMRPSILAIKNYRTETSATLGEALQHNQELPALVKYRELTGYQETNINAIWHHVRSLHGPLCSNCGKLLRTPKASYCAACGKRAMKDSE